MKRKFSKIWNNLGFSHFNISDRFNSGVPDAYVYGGGKAFWVEYKVDYNQPTKYQKHILSSLHEQSIPSYVIRARSEEYICYRVDDGEVVEMFRDDDVHKLVEDVIKDVIRITGINGAKHCSDCDRVHFDEKLPEGCFLQDWERR